ncbi:2,3-diaminopropionate biosynthesis protein SbnA, partial [Streptomyces sp. NPDC001514]
AVAIAPDLGERYLDTVYHTNWLHALYGEDVLSSDEVAAGSCAASPAPTTRSGQRSDLQRDRKT